MSEQKQAPKLRMIASHSFEDGGFVQITCTDDVATEALDMLENYIRLKREELSRRAATAPRSGETHE